VARTKLDLKKVKGETPLIDINRNRKEENIDRSKILIVEDSEDVSTYLDSILNESYFLDFASDGKKGLELALNEVPDLIISDVMMPEMDGYEFCEAIKQNEITAHIPVILLTAKVEREDVISGLGKGADAYLTKPFDKEELLTRIHQLLLLRERLRKSFRQGSKTVTKQTDPFLLKVNEILANNYTEENFKTPELCKELHYSKMQVHRKLKALTGLSASSYIKEYRLDKAKEGLLTPGTNISSVAYDSGFSSVPYFSRLFKEKYNVSPSQFIADAGKGE